MPSIRSDGTFFDHTLTFFVTKLRTSKCRQSHIYALELLDQQNKNLDFFRAKGRVRTSQESQLEGAQQRAGLIDTQGVMYGRCSPIALKTCTNVVHGHFQHLSKNQCSSLFLKKDMND